MEAFAIYDKHYVFSRVLFIMKHDFVILIKIVITIKLEGNYTISLHHVVHTPFSVTIIILKLCITLSCNN